MERATNSGQNGQSDRHVRGTQCDPYIGSTEEREDMKQDGLEDLVFPYENAGLPLEHVGSQWANSAVRSL